MADRDRRVAAEYLAWDQPLRGWISYDIPVELEPPFSPFQGYRAYAPEPQEDDGRLPGLFERVSRYFSRSEPVAPRHELPARDLRDEVEHHGGLPRGAEIQLRLPRDPHSVRGARGRCRRCGDRASHARARRRPHTGVRPRVRLAREPQGPRRPAGVLARALVPVAAADSDVLRHRSAVVRLAVRTGEVGRSWDLVNRLGNALLYARGENELAALEADRMRSFTEESDLLGRSSHRGGFLTSLREIAMLAHPPAQSVPTEQLRATPLSTAPVPRAPRTGQLHLGTSKHRNDVHPAYLSAEDRTRCVHVIGATGTGKSTLLFHMIRQDLEAGRGFALLDPHGDLADAVLGCVPEHRIESVVHFDPADLEHPVGFNVVGAADESERALLASDLTAIRNVVAQPTGRFDVSMVMQGRGVLVARLGHGELGRENAHLLGSLLVARLQLAALARARTARNDRRPFSIYIDEFHNFLTPSLTAPLSGARKFGVGLILAHQDLHQPTDPELRSAVLANAGARVALRGRAGRARTTALSQRPARRCSGTRWSAPQVPAGSHQALRRGLRLPSDRRS